MITIVVYLLLLIVLTPPLGAYLHRVYTRTGTGRIEGVVYRLIGVNPEAEQSWRRYATAVLWFSVISMVFVYLVMRFQQHLPLNPQGVAGVNPYLSFNTAASFMTNTNWQSYGGETTMSYLSQMLALTFQNFVSAAVGIAVVIAMIRGFTRTGTDNVGNFWRDLVRGVVYVLIPMSILVAIVLMSQGVVQTLSPSASITGIQGFAQTIARGPVASQIAIKQLGTNGGGFFNVNSAHPFENATPLSNFIEVLAILLIPAALCYTFGRMVKDTRQGWVLLAAMTILLFSGVPIGLWAEQRGNPLLADLGVDQQSQLRQAGGNMEGKETRFGITDSVLWSAVTTAASNGAVNSMHDSFTPLGGLVPLFLMQFGEVVFGGVGSGLYGMIVFAVIAVFIAGLMVGRTPEYLGKKFEHYEMKMAALLILIMPIIVLSFTALAVGTETGRSSILNPGPHGFSEILYAYSSQGNNNGSAFA